MRQSSRKLDALEVVFDDPDAVANGGLVLPMTLAARLGLKELVDADVHLGDAPGRANVGQKAVALVASALVGGDSIDDAEVLRAGRCGHRARYLGARPLHAGHVLAQLQLGRRPQLGQGGRRAVEPGLVGRCRTGARAANDRPRLQHLPDLRAEKTRCPLRLHQRAGPAPLLATASGTGDVLGVRQRGGNAHTARGAASFLSEVFNRVRAAGATGQLTLRADSGFYNNKVSGACAKAGVRFSITAKMSQSLRKVVEKIPEEAGRGSPTGWRVVPTWPRRPTRLSAKLSCASSCAGKAHPGRPLALFTKYEYHAFVTDRQGAALDWRPTTAATPK